MASPSLLDLALKIASWDKDANKGLVRLICVRCGRSHKIDPSLDSPEPLCGDCAHTAAGDLARGLAAAAGTEIPMLRRALGSIMDCEEVQNPSGWGPAGRIAIEALTKPSAAAPNANAHVASLEAQLASAWGALVRAEQALAADVAKLDSIGRLLSDNGCDCACDHHHDEHAAECDRCLGCRIGMVIQTGAAP